MNIHESLRVSSTLELPALLRTSDKSPFVGREDAFQATLAWTLLQEMTCEPTPGMPSLMSLLCDLLLNSNLGFRLESILNGSLAAVDPRRATRKYWCAMLRLLGVSHGTESTDLCIPFWQSAIKRPRINVVLGAAVTMGGLLDLPPEIFENICSNSNTPEHSQLVKTCRSLSEVAKPFLHAHPRFSGRDSLAIRQRWEGYIEAIRANRAIAPMVKSITYLEPAAFGGSIGFWGPSLSEYGAEYGAFWAAECV